MLGAVALSVRILDPQDVGAALLACEKPIE
jgi:hypothetical protein